MITNSPGKENQTPIRQTRSAKKRVAALLDEDSVDYVPIQKPDSAKKAKLTDHQKETFLAPRDKLPYMEEESIQIKSDLLQTRVGSQYDVESNEATVSNFSKLGSQKESTSKAPASFEALHAEQQKTKAPLVNNNISEKKRGRPKRTSTEETSTALKTASVKKEEAPKKAVRTRRSQVETKTEKSKDDKEKKKESSEKTAKKSEKSKESVKNLEPEKKPVEEEGAVILGTRSRRSLLKGTPTKYVAKPRTPRTPTGRSQKKEADKVKKEEESDDDHVPLGVLAKKSLKIVEAVKKEVEETKKRDQESSVVAPGGGKSVDHTPQPVSEEKMDTATSATVQMKEKTVVEVSKGPEKKENTENLMAKDPEPVEMAYEEPPAPETLLTPPRNPEIQIFVNPTSHSTPGILKTAGTPTTQGKKHVHFDQDVALKEDERSTPKRKRIDSFFKRTEPSTAPLFPGLIGNETPISKIVPRLTSVSTHGAFKILQSQLTNHKIQTVGDLAASSETLLSKVSIKLETAKRALEEFSKTAEIAVLSSPPLPIKAEIPICPAVVLPEENDEIRELKNIEGLSPKPSSQAAMEEEEDPQPLEEQVPIPVVESEQLSEESAMEAEIAEPVDERVVEEQEPVIEAAHTPLKDEEQDIVDILREAVEITTEHEIIEREPVEEAQVEGAEPVGEVEGVKSGTEPAVQVKGAELEEESTVEMTPIEAEVSGAVEGSVDVSIIAESLVDAATEPEPIEEALMGMEQPSEIVQKDTVACDAPVEDQQDEEPTEDPENESTIAEEEATPAKKPYNFKLFQIGIWALKQFITDHGNDLTTDESNEMVKDVESLLVEAKKYQK